MGLRMTASLDKIRADIDALDAELRALLLARADLVNQVAQVKAHANSSNSSNSANAADELASPLRPLREMQQMQALLAWQKAEAPGLSPNGLVAIWREIIGMALAQQGGLTICASAAAGPVARAHFGASLTYQTCRTGADALAECAGKPRSLAVLTVDEATGPVDGLTVLARLPVLGAPQALIYGAANETADKIGDGEVALVRRDALQAGDRLIFQAADYALVETDDPQDDAVWGRYLPPKDAS